MLAKACIARYEYTSMGLLYEARTSSSGQTVEEIYVSACVPNLHFLLVLMICAIKLTGRNCYAVTGGLILTT